MSLCRSLSHKYTINKKTSFVKEKCIWLMLVENPNKLQLSGGEWNASRRCRAIPKYQIALSWKAIIIESILGKQQRPPLRVVLPVCWGLSVYDLWETLIGWMKVKMFVPSETVPLSQTWCHLRKTSCPFQLLFHHTHNVLELLIGF